MTIPGFVKSKRSNKKKHWIDYNSARATDAFLGAVQAQYPNNFMTHLKDQNLESLTQKLEKVKIILNIFQLYISIIFFRTRLERKRCYLVKMQIFLLT